MRNKIIYRCWQGIFWGSYVSVLFLQTKRYTGWQPHIVFDYLLFFGYCVGIQTAKGWSRTFPSSSGLVVWP